MKNKTAHSNKNNLRTLSFVTLGVLFVLVYAVGWYIYIGPKDTYCMTQKEVTSLPPEKIKTAFEYFQLADYYFEQGDCTRALANYTYSIDIKPTAEAYNNRAYTYMRLQDYIHALSDLDMAISLRPTYSTALANRGDIHLFYYAKNLRRAIEDYDKAISANEPIKNSICGHRAMAITKYNQSWNIFSYLHLKAQPKNFGCAMPTPF